MALDFRIRKGFMRSIIPGVIVLTCILVAFIYWLQSFEFPQDYGGRIRFLYLARGDTFIIDNAGRRIVVPYASNGSIDFWSAVEARDSISITDSVVIIWKPDVEPIQLVIGR
jgi:hypothetical protein